MTQSDDAGRPSGGHAPGGHVPVMLEELVAAVATDRDGQYVDATYGRGGHARRLLAELSPRARLLVVDRDAEAIADAERLAVRDSRVSVARGRFGDLADHLAAAEPSAGEREGRAPRKREPRLPCGVVFDVGVSSPQLDDARRGFSFALDGPLDMRMDQRDALTASTWLNTASAADVEAVIREYGEERFARRIARRVVAERPLETTAELASVIRAAVPGGPAARNSAARVFQAIRIHLNDELNELARGLDAAFDALGAGGRLATITFHSLEHRLVRQRFRQWVRGPDVPRRLPVRGHVTGRARLVAGVGNGRRPSEEEIEANPRARSAFLQAVEKEPSAGEREGRAPRKREPSAGEREGPVPRKKDPSAGERPRREATGRGIAPRTSELCELADWWTEAQELDADDLAQRLPRERSPRRRRRRYTRGNRRKSNPMATANGATAAP